MISNIRRLIPKRVFIKKTDGVMGAGINQLIDIDTNKLNAFYYYL